MSVDLTDPARVRGGSETLCGPHRGRAPRGKTTPRPHATQHNTTQAQRHAAMRPRARSRRAARHNVSATAAFRANGPRRRRHRSGGGGRPSRPAAGRRVRWAPAAAPRSTRMGGTRNRTRLLFWRRNPQAYLVNFPYERSTRLAARGSHRLNRGPSTDTPHGWRKPRRTRSMAGAARELLPVPEENEVDGEPAAVAAPPPRDTAPQHDEREGRRVIAAADFLKQRPSANASFDALLGWSSSLRSAPRKPRVLISTVFSDMMGSAAPATDPYQAPAGPPPVAGRPGAPLPANVLPPVSVRARHRAALH